jgi:predicted metal-dependent HD superfamily phosphohydrolase
MLKDQFTELAIKYNPDLKVASELWSELEKGYTAKGRHYHTFTHIQNLIHQLSAVKDNIEDWDAILFAAYYHDAVYNTLKQNNEEHSAVLAVKSLDRLGVPENVIKRCEQHIVATKGHTTSPDQDTNLFTDADLSVLGQEWSIYNAYAMQIRKEYSLYPDLVYVPGRKKVLNYFLRLERIYKTAYFYDRYEAQARQNLLQELNSL